MSEENKIVEEEESEDDQDKQDNNQLKKTKLCEIIIDDKNSLKGIKFDKEKYVEDGLLEEAEDIKLYTNLYPIKFKKPIQINEYHFIIKPECHEESVILKILREVSPWLFKTYGYYYRSGNSFFAVRCVEKENKTKVVIHHREWIQYTIVIQAASKSTTIEKGQKHDFEEIAEKVLFLVIREILSANPYVHFDRDNLYLENKKEEIKGYNNSYYIHDGYKISIQQAAIGLCLIIGVKNKIKGKLTILDYINNNNDEEIENLIGRRFIPYEGSRSQIIADIDYDRNPVNTIRNYRQQTFSYLDYYQKVWNIEIKDKKQPLILVDVKDPQYKEKPKYYVPELCYLVGINEEDTRDFQFMQEIVEKTRLNPDEKISQIEKCIDLFVETAEKKSVNNDEKGENLNTIYDDVNNTSKKKMDFYGIEINKLDKKFIKPYYICQPSFSNNQKNYLEVRDVNGVLPVGREEVMGSDWICLYAIQAEQISFELLNGFIRCCKGYHLKFKNNDSNWIPMQSQNIKDWTYIVEKELNRRKNCKFVIFLLNNKTDKLYAPLKKHSLCTKGYISQVIKYESIMRAIKQRRGRLDSYFSKILLQINNKLGGFNYFLETDKIIDEHNILLIGIDSSHTWRRRNNKKQIGVAMVATKDKNFSKFYSKEDIFNYNKHYYSQSRMSMAAFIEEAFEQYKKENKGVYPKNIIIYRQGIAHNHLNKIELEVLKIQEICKKFNIHYHYVLVNTRTTIKFFEYNVINRRNENTQKYKNPKQGLVILDQITNLNRFEFFIQPQLVNIGSATPTYFHVAYGDLVLPKELLIKLTYWTTYIYPNWQNAVRIPHVLKMAEKLSSVTAKFTQSALNEDLSDKQSFL